VFLLPLIIIYELGTRTPPTGGSHQIVAFTLLQQFFQLFGASGRHLPALAVVGILLSWHVARRDDWNVRPSTLLGMTAESILLCLPLRALGSMLAFLLPNAALASVHAPPPNMFVLSIGAGIYEELVFRLMVFTLLILVFKNLLRFGKVPAGLAAVVLSAVLFSGYHYLGSEVFHFRTFAFRTLAGVYFGALFLFRGFGITAASHAAYDVLTVAL
jgi:membrane protease YdiL (CAAX protease family)